MVGLAAQDREAAVELLEEDHPGEAVGKGDAAESQEERGAPAELLGEPVGAPDREDDRPAAAALGLLVEEPRDLLRGAVLAPLVEEDQGVPFGEGARQGRFVPDLSDGEIRVAAQAFLVLRLRSLEVGLLQPTDGEDEELQRQ